jgi:hypothetical protein
LNKRKTTGMSHLKKKKKNCISCVPRCLSASCVFVVSRVANRTRMSCSERYGYTKCPAICTFLHSFIVRYNYMHTYTIVEWSTQCTVVISCYCLMFKPYVKICFFGEDYRHIVPNNAHFKLLLWSDENTFSRKSLNAVSLGVPSTCPPKCAHIILIRYAESSVWYFISILLFHVQKLFNWFSKYVWYIVAHICVNSCFHSWNENGSSKYQDEEIPICLQ